jgi:3-deoxy-D-manno-octulosonate 8-phosphate phosphatase (KDO 8-P phosphatase)
MKNKVQQIDPLLKKLGLGYDEIAFMGNELLDIELAEKAALGIAVADSASELLEAADYVTEHKGGEGAVREVIECYFSGAGLDPRKVIV